MSVQIPDAVPQADRQDIEELERRIRAYQMGGEDEERFKLYRLTRGVYGQRQAGVQMFRTKIPFGRLTAKQLVALADISERYTNGRLHLTTRQNVQLHYVKLQDSPALWSELAAAGMTAREACGNTVRNVTASALAGIDPEEPFDVAPYVQATFEYFLRNPICQEMGRKIKIAFSASDRDSAFSYFHDFGFIPRLQKENGREIRGFKVLVGGGLGAVPKAGFVAYEFLPAQEIIPYMEAAIRVFDRYGEREKRMKARMKFLIQKLGVETFCQLVEAERPAVKHQQFPIAQNLPELPLNGPADTFPEVSISDSAYSQWTAINVLPQKQANYYAVCLRIPLGNLNAEQARLLAELARTYAADDLRISVNQGMVLRFVPPSALPHLYRGLQAIGLAEAGFDTTADVTACPGTDTCALGVTNSTGLAQRLEAVIRDEYPELVGDRNLQIKISGCMNSCGQHMAAAIGLHGSSIRVEQRIVPAMQVVLGGGLSPDGRGFMAEKIIKLPTKRIPAAVRRLIADYREGGQEGEYYQDYVARQGRRYFYDLLKALAATEDLQDTDYFDWGQDRTYIQQIGTGECAGAALDVVGTILQDASDKVATAVATLEAGHPTDAIYHAYTAFVVAAKALLLSQDIKCNTQIKILEDFQNHFADQAIGQFEVPFAEHVLRMKKREASEAFAASYLADARAFVQRAVSFRKAALTTTNAADKVVITNYYNA